MNYIRTYSYQNLKMTYDAPIDINGKLTGI